MFLINQLVIDAIYQENILFVPVSEDLLIFLSFV